MGTHLNLFGSFHFGPCTSMVRKPDAFCDSSDSRRRGEPTMIRDLIGMSLAQEQMLRSWPKSAMKQKSLN